MVGMSQHQIPETTIRTSITMQTPCLTRLLVITASLALYAGSGQAQTAGGTNPPTRLPEVTVTATNETELKENMLIGDNQQPVWTARRRFVTTRVYVQPAWQGEVEVGWQDTIGRTGTPSHLITEEIELGLPYRFQIDFENGDAHENGDWHHDFNAFELRWALADWDKIFGNPTVGAEWRINNGEADAFELKLQFGGDMCSHVHWGVNFFYEQQVGDDREREFAAATGISYTIIDEKLSAGVEAKFSSESDSGSRDNPQNTLEIGPSFQWRPTKKTHLDFVPLFGVTGHAPAADLFLFFGFDFGRGSSENDAVAPASLRNK